MRSPSAAPSRGVATSTREPTAAEWLVERILVAVECVPPGSVVSYGDVAALVGTGPRIVGQVMARYGSEVCWWRVTNTAGKLPAHLIPEAATHWRAEGIGVSNSGSGCRIDSFRADLLALACAYERRLARISRRQMDL